MSAVPLKIPGSSGNQYDFVSYPWNSGWNPIGVVYAVLKFASGQWHLLYVGETGDLKQRMANHHRQPAFDRHQKTHLAVLVENSASRRQMIERDIMGKHTPPCNREV